MKMKRIQIRQNGVRTGLTKIACILITGVMVVGGTAFGISVAEASLTADIMPAEDFRIEYESDRSLYKFGDTQETLVMSGYRLPVFTGSDPSLEAANAEVKRIKEKVLSEKELMEASADQQRRGISDPSAFYTRCSVASTETLYDDGCFLSLAIGNYAYTGGPHGFTETEYMNFDRETGRLLQLNDVIGIGEMEFESLLNGIIQTTAPDGVGSAPAEITGTRNLRDYAFYFAKNGIHIQFGEYEIGSFSAGAPDFVIPYEELNLQTMLQPENSALSYDRGYYYYFDETEEMLLEQTGTDSTVIGEAESRNEENEDEGGPLYSSVEEIERVFIPWDEAGLEDHPLVFADPNAEYKVRALLDRQDGDIFLSDLWEMKNLDLTPADGDHLITDIGFVSELKNLTVLNLNYNSISDLSPVQGLSELEGLFFNANLVSDISPLTMLKKLNRIDMSNNPISDFTPLKKLTALTVIHSYGNGITDASFDNYISCVEKLPLLVKLDFGANAVTDFSPLEKVQQISELSIWEGGIDDAGLVRLVDVVSHLPELKKLSLVRNRIADVTPLSILTGLTELNLKGNKITDVAPLAGLVNLEKLILSENAISNLSPLAQLQTEITAEDMREAPTASAASTGEEYATYATIASTWNKSFQAALQQEDLSAYSDAGIVAGGYVVHNIVNGFVYNREDPGTVTFSLIDLNDDGTSELMIGIYRTDAYSGVPYHSVHDIYAWDAVGETYRKITPPYLELYLLGDKTVMSRTGKGSAGYDFYHYTGGEEMEWYDVYEHCYGDGDAKRKWYWQGERVTADDFNQAVLSHGMLTYQAYPVTEENLAALAAGNLTGLVGSIECTESFEPYEE